MKTLQSCWRFKIVNVVILAAVSAAAAQPVTAAAGKVVVFELETVKLTEFADPKPGCYKLPAAAHVLTNMTNAPVKIYADPACLTPGLTVSPGFGSHVAPGSGSFSV